MFSPTCSVCFGYSNSQIFISLRSRGIQNYNFDFKTQFSVVNMKIYKLILLICLMSIVTTSQIIDYEKIRQSPDWSTITRLEKMSRFQIPEQQLIKMSTHTLLLNYLNSPYCSWIFSNNYVENGFDFVHMEFNGLRELIKRDDLVSIATKYYEQLEFDRYEQNWNEIEWGEYRDNFVHLEILLSRHEVLSKLNTDGKKNILRVLLVKLNRKLNSQVGCVIEDLGYGLYAMANILSSMGENKTITELSNNEFILTGRHPSERAINSIISAVDLVIKSKN